MLAPPAVRGVRNESEELGGGLEVQRDWSCGLPQKISIILIMVIFIAMRLEA